MPVIRFSFLDCVRPFSIPRVARPWRCWLHPHVWRVYRPGEPEAALRCLRCYHIAAATDCPRCFSSASYVTSVKRPYCYHCENDEVVIGLYCLRITLVVGFALTLAAVFAVLAIYQ